VPEKKSDVTEDKEFQAIEQLVEQAKELENNQKLKEAKIIYLDAAQGALNLSKIKKGLDKLSYEQIARSLIQYVKELNLIIQMEEHPLPSAPSKGRKFTTKSGQEMQVQAQEMVEVRDVLLEIMILAEGGIPTFDYYNESVSIDLKRRVNEILFSGAITAITQLMSEIIERPIQQMSFEGATIYMKTKKTYTFVFLAYSDDLNLENILDLLSTEFFSTLNEDLEREIKQGRSLNDNKEINKLVNRVLSHKIPKPME
jgi:hypothetical protein